MSSQSPMNFCSLTVMLAALFFGSTAGWCDEDLQKVEALEALFKTAADKSNPRTVAEEFQTRFETLAMKFSGTESGLRAELWILRNHWWKRSAGTMEEAATKQVRRLITEYSDSPQLSRIAEFRYLYDRDEISTLMDELIEASPHDRVDAWAIHAKVYTLRRSKDPQDIARSRKSLELLRDRYGAVPFRDSTFGAIAVAMLSPHPAEDLVVGKVAPEIEGSDVDGNIFRLSDFRGRVVLIDFWGDW
ncbi:MAG TPA: hypothetical protein EYO84_10170 [Planctomycetes bacterium]|nr:hypothetical protein [Planctomycetota bacterium]